MSLDIVDSDNFGGTRIDSSKWDTNGFWYSPGSTSAGGADLDNSSQCTLDGKGHFVLTGVRRASPSHSWLSCMIESAPESGRTGIDLTPPFYVVFSAQLPAPGPGLWPALYLLHDPDLSPRYQEADVMESRGFPDLFWTTWHPNIYQELSHGPFGGVDLSDGYHTFGIYMTETRLRWYFDGRQVGAAIPIVDPGHFFIVIALGVGSATSWSGPADSLTPSPSIFKLNYVHVYR
ncbi:MAG: glycoside hydrolase family 16 protein [Acidimicrobiales bacterium]